MFLFGLILVAAQIPDRLGQCEFENDQSGYENGGSGDDPSARMMSVVARRNAGDVENDKDDNDVDDDDDEDDEDDVLWDFRDTDVIEDGVRPAGAKNAAGAGGKNGGAAVPTAATAKKTPKYQIRHQSLTPSAEDSRQFCVDKDQLGR